MSSTSVLTDQTDTSEPKPPRVLHTHDHERMVLQRRASNPLPALRLLVATKCMRGSDDLEEHCPRRASPFSKVTDVRASEMTGKDSAPEDYVDRGRQHCLLPGLAWGRVVAKHKLGWVRNPVPVPAWGGAPASGHFSPNLLLPSSGVSAAASPSSFSSHSHK